MHELGGGRHGTKEKVSATGVRGNDSPAQHWCTDYSSSQQYTLLSRHLDCPVQEIMVHITAGLPRIYMPVIVSVEYSGDLSPHKDCGGFVCCGLSLVIHTSGKGLGTLSSSEASVSCYTA